MIEKCAVSLGKVNVQEENFLDYFLVSSNGQEKVNNKQS